MTEAAMSLPETFFLTTEEALSYAFAMEAKKLQPTLSVEQIIKSTNPSDLTMEERIADGILIKNTALSYLGMKGKALILAEFTVPADKSLDNRKQGAIETLRGFIYQDNPKLSRNRYFVEDIIREWTGERPHHDLKWWSEHMNIPYSTLRRWARERGENRSIFDSLNQWRQNAMTLVRVTLAEHGITP